MSERAAFRVVSGSPTPEELAALAALVATAGASEPTGVERVRRGIWSDPAGRLRRPLRPGHGGWRASAR